MLSAAPTPPTPPTPPPPRPRRRRAVGAGLLASVIGATVWLIAQGNPTYTVNDNRDDVDVAPGDGTCATAAGTCTLRAAIQEANATAGAKVIAFALPNCGATTRNAGTGFRAEYFNNITLSGTPALARNEVPNFDWAGGPPGAGVNADQFSVRWRGQIVVPTTGSYSFRTTSDDGVRLWVNGRLIVENWSDHPPTVDTSAPVTLTAGQRATVVMEFYENFFGAVARLEWLPPGGAWSVVPLARVAGGACTIQPTSPLPAITVPVTVNATTQPGWSAGAPLVELVGDRAGTGASGLELAGAGSTVSGLVVNRFAADGVRLQAGGQVLAGSWIGPDASGLVTAGNGGDGVELVAGSGMRVGGTAAGEANVISGNAGGVGVRIGTAATGALVQGNLIGLGSDGATALGNAQGGVQVDGTGATVGGASAAARNVISGNGSPATGFHGVGVCAGDTTVRFNYIGTNASGAAAVGNANDGVSGCATFSGTVQVLDNLLSGNGRAGVTVWNNGDAGAGAGGTWTLLRNSIGTNAAGTLALANGWRTAGGGVLLMGSGATVGDGTAANGNLISGNTGPGVLVAGSATAGNRIRANRISGNSALGIDLGTTTNTPGAGANTVTANDGAAPAGQPNRQMDFPVLHSAVWAGDQLQLVGRVGSAPGQALFENAVVDVYRAAADPLGHGEGQAWLGTLVADANGVFDGRITVPGGVTLFAADTITATATDAAGNTSEFSQNLAVTAATAFQNGSFETVSGGFSQPPSGGFAVLVHGDRRIAGWTVLSQSVDWVRGFWPSAAGANSLDGHGTQSGGVQQSFVTVPGRGYIVRWRAALNDSCTSGGNRTYTVTAAGGTSTTTTDTVTPVNSAYAGNWATRSMSFVAGSGLTTLSFRSAPGGDSCGPAWDDVALVDAVALSGTVFEDVNYGGGAGRARASAAGAVGLPGVRVELYDAAGALLQATTSGADGSYAFAVLGGATYTVRVVTATVPSSRPGATAGLLPVQTFRAHAPSGTVVAVTDEVGGPAPWLPDTATGSMQQPWSFCANEYETCVMSLGTTGRMRYGLNGTWVIRTFAPGATVECGNAVFGDPLFGIVKRCELETLAATHSASTVQVGGANVAGLDFGYNFDTVVNTNNAGQGSLRQFVVNANTLGGEAALAQAGRAAGVETSIFQLRNTDPGFQAASTSWRIALAAALPAVTGPATALDASTQSGAVVGNLWAGTPHGPRVALDGGGGAFPGVTLAGDDATLRGFAIGNVGSHGVLVSGGARGRVVANHIGLDVAGSTGTAVGGDGVRIAGGSDVQVGGAGTGDGNVIAGGDAGVRFQPTTGLTIRGNFIGTNATGTARVGTRSAGIGAVSGTSTIREIRANLIAGATAGLSFDADDTLQPAAGNPTWSIAGNRIGTDRAGAVALPNQVGLRAQAGGRIDGLVIGGTSAADANVVSGNTEVGIAWEQAAGTGNRIVGNVIGRNAANTANLPNAVHGLRITGAATLAVGGVAAGEANVIAGNGTGAGVAIQAGVAATVTVRGNAMFGNGGGGIDLGIDGPSPNDDATPAGQPNRGLDTPVVGSAALGGGQLFVQGWVGTAAGRTLFAGATVDLYRSSRHASGFGEGQAWLGTLTADANGTFRGRFAVPGGVTLASGDAITATATDAAGNTSEFSANVTVFSEQVVNNPGDGVDAVPGDGICATTFGGSVCTLRAAIMETNARAGAQVIRFELPACPGAGCTITPTSALPSISDATTVDAQTQPGWNPVSGAPIVVVSGVAAGSLASGLTVNAANATLRGLAVIRFGQHGVVFTALAAGGVLEGSHVGIDAAGTASAPNGGNGVRIQGGTGVRIGGTTPATRNVLSGNGREGVNVTAGSGHVLLGNYIGTTVTGASALPNGGEGGIALQGTVISVTVGGTAAGAGNVISGNALRGIWIGAGSHTIQGNLIGTNATGTAALRNNEVGIAVEAAGGAQQIGGTVPGARNVISGNLADGLWIGTTFAGGTVIEGNHIGVDATGTAAIPNGRDAGIWLLNGVSGVRIGGTAAGAGNVISGNAGHGVWILSGIHVVQGNRIGTDAAGSAGVANGRDGIRLSGSAGPATIGGPSPAARNVISGNTDNGIVIDAATASGTTIQGNHVGTDAAGTAAIRNGAPGSNTGGVRVQRGTGHLIGGTDPAARNLLSGNGGAGVWAAGGTATIQGNYIGTDVTGTVALGNQRWGVVLGTGTAYQIGGTAAGAGNLISGNTGDGTGGIYVSGASGTVIEGNSIGFNAAGTGFLPNGDIGGIEIRNASNVRIGGTTAASANRIAGNTGAGVAVQAGTGNTILRNVIRSNTGLGIDLGGGLPASATSPGVTPNDGLLDCTRANCLVDHPVITSARLRGTTLTVAGHVGSAPGQTAFGLARVDLYVSDGDPSGFGEGRAWLGTLTADAQGGFSGTVTVPASTAGIGARLTGTATVANSTSEFGRNFEGLVVDQVVNDNGDAPDANPGDGLCETATAGICTLRAAIQELNAWPALAARPLIAFGIPGCTSGTQAACRIAPATDLPAVVRPVAIDATTQGGFAGTPMIELSGASNPAAAATGLLLDTGSDASLVTGLRFTGWSGGDGAALRVSGARDVTVQGNWFGLGSGGGAGAANRAGLLVRNADGATIGGDQAAQRNLFAGSTAWGVQVHGGANATVRGNSFGLAADGRTPVPNGTSLAVHGAAALVGGAATGQGNRFGAAAVAHLRVSTDAGAVPGASATVFGNVFGVATDGTVLRSTSDAILVDGVASTRIGGTAPGEANTIAGGAGRGVGIAADARRVTVSGNAIFDHDGTGIDLGRDGATANTGVPNPAAANGGMNTPVLTSAGTDGITLSVTGHVGTSGSSAAFAGARVELFRADAAPPAAGDGAVYLGALTADSSGRFSGTVSLPPGALAIGQPITATATGTLGDTSEFGPNFVAVSIAAMRPARLNAFEPGTPVGALTGALRTRTAGRAADVAVIALDALGGGLHPSFTGRVTLEWLNARDNSAPLDPNGCRASWVPAGGAGGVDLTPAGGARGLLSITPPEAGREWRLRLSTTVAGETVTSCSTDAFAVRPETIAVTAAGSDASGTGPGVARSLLAPDPAGGVVHRAGRPFALRAEARAVGGTLTQGYDGVPTVVRTGCTMPAGCVPGTLSVAGLATAAGRTSTDAVVYGEVGTVSLRLVDADFASIDAADTSAAERTIESAEVSIGRFVPDRFVLSQATAPVLATAHGACAAPGAGFTFAGQTFGWRTAPALTVQAVAADGTATRNWRGTLQKLAPSGVSATVGMPGAPVALNAALQAPTVVDASDGRATVTFSGADRFWFERNTAAAAASFTAAPTLSVTVTDASEAAVAGNGTVSAAAPLAMGTGGIVGFDAGAAIHHGRLVVQHAFGDARRPLQAAVEVQRFTDRGWLRLAEAGTCLSVPAGAWAYTAGSGALSGGQECRAAAAPAAVALVQGRGTLALPKSPDNRAAAMTVVLNAGAAVEASACTGTGGAATPPTPMNLTHLLTTRPGNPALDRNPTARLSWGQPRSAWMASRELY